MPYDSSLDECLFTKANETDFDKITVSVMSYNKGAKKLQIVRQNKTQDGELRFTKLGRMTKEEVQVILPIMEEALKHME
jgi:predicted transcriptional regulator